MISGKHDFGDTTLFDALLRDTENLNSYINFGLQLGYATRNGDKQIAKYSQYVDCMHLYARLCLLLDILIGYSQKEAYADTIIINARNLRRIKVYKIRDILTRIGNDYTKLINYTDYKPKDIEDAIRDKHIEFSKELSN